MAATRNFGRLAILAIALCVGVATIPTAPAHAQIYPGWDFGNGFGIGIGPPPSAYMACPNYGWLYYPYGCSYRHAYYPVRRAHHGRHVARQY